VGRVDVTGRARRQVRRVVVHAGHTGVARAVRPELGMTILEGWDSHAWIVGPWIHRAPRRPEVRPRLLAEATLLPWLAPQLPLPVPVPELTTDGVRHLLLPGEPFMDGGIETGRALGAFLKALHGVDTAEAVAYGALDAAAATAEKTAFL